MTMLAGRAGLGPEGGIVARQGRLAAGRARHLDLFKTVLVAGMISAHVVQLIAGDPPRWAMIWSDYVNLVTFSGFLLAFGLGVGLSAGRGGLGRGRWSPLPKLALAVWASSLGYLALVEREALTGEVLRDVLTTRVLFGWSEFLTTFLVLYLLIAVARPALVAAATRPGWLLAACIACLSTTMLTTDRLWPLAGGVIGHRDYPNFPLLPYLPWFLVGVHLGARGRRLELSDLGVGLAATGAFALAWGQEGWMPERFPPSVPWIVGAGLPLALCLWGAERAAAWVPEAALAAGRHVLASLVLSNLAIFAIRYVWGWPVQGGWAILGTSLGLIAGVTLWGAVLDRLGQRRALP